MPSVVSVGESRCEICFDSWRRFDNKVWRSSQVFAKFTPWWAGGVVVVLRRRFVLLVSERKVSKDPSAAAMTLDITGKL